MPPITPNASPCCADSADTTRPKQIDPAAKKTLGATRHNTGRSNDARIREVMLNLYARRRTILPGLPCVRGSAKRNGPLALASPHLARAVLHKPASKSLFPGQLMCTPIEVHDGTRFRIEGTAAIGDVVLSEASVMLRPQGDSKLC